MDEWIEIMWYIYTQWNVIQSYETLSFITTWVDLEDIMLSKTSQTKKGKKWYDLTLYVQSKKTKYKEQIGDCQRPGGRDGKA